MTGIKIKNYDLNEPQNREQLKETHGEVWDTEEFTEDFTVISFMAPFVIVKSKEGVEGTIEFQHRPRYYYKFVPKT